MKGVKRAGRGFQSLENYRLRDANAVKFLIRDRDTKYTGSFDAVFAADGVRPSEPRSGHPSRTPPTSACGTLRRECLDKMLILGRRHLDAVLGSPA